MAARRGYLKPQISKEPTRTYTMKATCSNCKRTAIYEIQKGCLAEKELLSIECSTCGCCRVLENPQSPEGTEG